MTVVFSFVERRDKISNEWERIAGLVASTIEEAEEFIADYQKDVFDISEYRVCECSRKDFQSEPLLMVFTAPSLRERM